MAHSNEIIPADVRLAAKRAFVRTTYQGYAGALGTGITANAVLAVIDGFDPVVVAVTAAVAVVGPPLAGLAAWLDITRKGIPDDYATTVVVEG